MRAAEGGGWGGSEMRLVYLFTHTLNHAPLTLGALTLGTN